MPITTPAGVKKMTREEAKLILLRSLLDKPKIIHFGRTPVDAIELAMEMTQEGLTVINGKYIALTDKGRAHLAAEAALTGQSRGGS